MSYATTLNEIRDQNPCRDGWTKLLAHLGKTAPDDEPLELLAVLNSNGPGDAHWVLWNVMQPEHERLHRHFSAWCLDQVLDILKAKMPNYLRIKDQISMMRNDGATEPQRAPAATAANAAVWECAAWDDAWADAWAAGSIVDAQEKQLRKMLKGDF